MHQRACHPLALCLIAGMATAAATAALAGTIAESGMGNVNNDAMTVAGCHERLRLPASARPKDDDPRVDLDAVCRNILGASAPASPRKKPARVAHAAAASAASR